MFFKREVMFFELPGAGGNDIFWAPRTVYFNLYAFCGASDINNFWQCLHILYECVFDSFTGTDLALAPTPIPAPSLSLTIYISSISISKFGIFYMKIFCIFFCVLHFAPSSHVSDYFRRVLHGILLRWLFYQWRKKVSFYFPIRIPLNDLYVGGKAFFCIFLVSTIFLIRFTLLYYLSIIFWKSPLYFFYFSNTLFLWRFPIFIPHSRCTKTWLTKKRKRTRNVFLIESVCQCIDMCIYICT